MPYGMAQVSINGNGPAMVGRAQTCDVVIKHMSVSNLHCEIGVEGDEDPPRCYVKDLSSNGTWVRRWTGDREGHSKAERLKKGATFPLGSGDLVLLLPPTHADCLAFQLRVSCDPLKRCAVLCDTQNLTSIYARTERPDVVEETGRKIPKRCKEHLLGGIRRDPENESLHSAVEGRNGALRARPPSILQCTDGQSGEEHVYPTVTMVKEPCMPNLHSNCCKELCLAGESHDLMKEQKASETMATPSILTSVAMKDTAHLCTNEGGSHTPVTTPPAKGVTSPAKGTTPPVTTPPGGAEEELCPLCGCIFPLSMLVAHCESCSGGVGGRGPLSATPPRTPPLLTAPASLRPTVSLEQCPKCSALFSLPELIPHWEVCSKKGANKVVCEEDGGDCVEQCIHCLKDYLLSDLLEHVKTCPMKDKKVGWVSNIWNCAIEFQIPHDSSVMKRSSVNIASRAFLSVSWWSTSIHAHIMYVGRYGCMGVWVHGDMGVWVHGSMGVREYHGKVLNLSDYRWKSRSSGALHALLQGLPPQFPRAPHSSMYGGSLGA